MNDLEKSQQLLSQLVEQRFFGTVSFQLKRGEIVLVRQESTLVPSDLPSKGGRTDHERNQSR